MASFPVLLESFARFHQSEALAGHFSQQLLPWAMQHLWLSLCRLLEQGQDAPASSLVPGFAGGKELGHDLCHPASGLEGRPCPLLFTSLDAVYEIRA